MTAALILASQRSEPNRARLAWAQDWQREGLYPPVRLRTRSRRARRAAWRIDSPEHARERWLRSQLTWLVTVNAVVFGALLVRALGR